MARLFTTTLFTAAVLAFVLVASGCGSSSDSDTSAPAPPQEEGLTAAQLENGIGPITELELAEINPDLVATGTELYTLKCSSCHKLDTRYIGPPLADVTLRRTPEYVMNMMLNPEEMVQKHPEAKKLLAEYIAPMANQSLTTEEARAILEYLRSEEREIDV